MCFSLNGYLEEDRGMKGGLEKCFHFKEYIVYINIFSMQTWECRELLICVFPQMPNYSFKCLNIVTHLEMHVLTYSKIRQWRQNLHFQSLLPVWKTVTLQTVDLEKKPPEKLQNIKNNIPTYKKVYHHKLACPWPDNIISQNEQLQLVSFIWKAISPVKWKL